MRSSSKGIDNSQGSFAPPPSLLTSSFPPPSHPHSSQTDLFYLFVHLVKARSLLKSMLSSKDTFPALDCQADADPWLRLICVELISRLQEARGGTDGVEGDDVWPKTLVLSYRDGELSTSRLSRSSLYLLLFPFRSSKLTSLSLSPRSQPTYTSTKSATIINPNRSPSLITLLSPPPVPSSFSPRVFSPRSSLLERGLPTWG